MQLTQIGDAPSFPCYFMLKLLTGSETNTAEARNVLEAGRGGMTPSGSWTRQTKTSHALCKTTATTGKLTLTTPFVIIKTWKRFSTTTKSQNYMPNRQGCIF